MNELVKEKRDIDSEIKTALQINDADLLTELKEQSTHLFYYGSMWARAIRAERHQKLVVEGLESELSREFRDVMRQSDPTTSVTVKMLKEFLDGHPTYIEAQQKLVQAGYIADMFNVAKSAFESRGRMLLELARQTGDSRFYNAEYQAMKGEFELREEKKASGRRMKKGHAPLVASDEEIKEARKEE
jgi:hypothetical protein